MDSPVFRCTTADARSTHRISIIYSSDSGVAIQLEAARAAAEHTTTAVIVAVYVAEVLPLGLVPAFAATCMGPVHGIHCQYLHLERRLCRHTSYVADDPSYVTDDPSYVNAR